VPPKAIRERLETTELGFEYRLADRLKMTVGRMRREMSSMEFQTWAVYHGIRDQHAELAREQARG
jgi:hypothetical protein